MLIARVPRVCHGDMSDQDWAMVFGVPPSVQVRCAVARGDGQEAQGLT